MNHVSTAYQLGARAALAVFQKEAAAEKGAGIQRYTRLLNKVHSQGGASGDLARSFLSAQRKNLQRLAKRNNKTRAEWNAVGQEAPVRFDATRKPIVDKFQDLDDHVWAHASPKMRQKLDPYTY